MKVHCVGSRFFGGQVDRIERGFVQLGHELTPHISEADLVYVNDPSHYAQPLLDRAAGRLKGKLILNVLDIPEHIIHEFDTTKLYRELIQADAITSISQFTHDKVGEHCGIASHVIYNPIKSVARDPASKRECPYRFASVGRRSDPNKRADLWAGALGILGINYREVALVGSDPGWGDYLGVLSDFNLNLLYNSVDFVLATSRVEGLNLPVLEAMAAGAIPVVCRDMTTRTELLPPDLFPEYQEVEPTGPSVARFIARYLNSSEQMVGMKIRLHEHYVTSWQEKTSGAGVARRILEVYQGLVSDDADYRYTDSART